MGRQPLTFICNYIVISILEGKNLSISYAFFAKPMSKFDFFKTLFLGLSKNFRNYLKTYVKIHCAYARPIPILA